MTGRPMRLTDDTLHRALVELAGDPDVDALMSDVMRAVDAAPQVRRRPWDVGGWGGALLVAALLATLGIGAAVALSQLDPDPQPIPSTPAVVPDAIDVPEFVVPFRYQVPEGAAHELTALASGPPSTLHGLLAGRGNLTIFLVTGFVHSCQLEAPDPSSEPGRTSEQLHTDPARFVEQLRDRLGVAIGAIRPTTLGNLPAVEAQLEPSEDTCYPQIHERPGIGALTIEPELRGPGKLIVARTESATIAVLINADGAAFYDEWLPTAEAYVDSFDFYGADR